MNFSKYTYAQITKHRVVAKMTGITLTSLPFSNAYDHQEGIKSGDLRSYQMEHLPIEAQVVLAQHQIDKVKRDISSWRWKNSENGINMSVGINDKERYDIFKNASEYLGGQMNSAMKALGQVDKSIPEKWNDLSERYRSDIRKIEAIYQQKRGCHKERLDALIPALVQYLDMADQFIDALKELERP